MKRTTIFVPETLERDLQLAAKAQGKPAASIVREALAEYLARRTSAAQLPAFVGAFASGRSDTAERQEELLFATLDPKARRGQSTTRQTARRSKARAKR